MDILPFSAPPRTRYSSWLPYWAVLQADLKQVFRSWVFRLWLLAIIISATGYALYKTGVYQEAGIVQVVSLQMSELSKGLAGACLFMIALISATTISGERLAMAESVLCRGISRYQYYLAKWHARLFSITITFSLLSIIILVTYHYLLASDITRQGAVMALGMILSIIFAVVSVGVALSSMVKNHLLGITLFALLLMTLFALASLIPSLPAPSSLLEKIRLALRGHYHQEYVMNTMIVSLSLGFLVSSLGLFFFSRKDV